MIVSERLLAAMSTDTRRLLRARQGFPMADEQGAYRLMPQPWFVTEVMKGYIAELEFMEYLKVQFGIGTLLGDAESNVRVLDQTSDPDAAALYQVYDFTW